MSTGSLVLMILLAFTKQVLTSIVIGLARKRNPKGILQGFKKKIKRVLLKNRASQPLRHQTMHQLEKDLKSFLESTVSSKTQSNQSLIYKSLDF